MEINQELEQEASVSFFQKMLLPLFCVFIGIIIGFLFNRLFTDDFAQENEVCKYAEPLVEVESDVESDSIIKEEEIRIETYGVDENNGNLIAKFQISNYDKYSKVTYWTDADSACNAITDDISDIIEVSLDENTKYTFFQFMDLENNRSQIFAQSHYPIFQCGSLVE